MFTGDDCPLCFQPTAGNQIESQSGLVGGYKNSASSSISVVPQSSLDQISLRKVPLEVGDGIDMYEPRSSLLFASSSSSSVQPPEGAAAAGASKLFEEGAGLPWDGVSDGVAVHQKASLFSPIVSLGDHAAQILSTQSTAAPSSSFRQGNARWNDTAPAVGRHGSSHRAINRMNQLLSSTSDNSAICDLPVGGATRNAVRSNRTSESSSRAANVAKVVSPSSAVVSGTEADEKAEKDARRDVSSVDSVNVESADNGRGKSERPSVSELRKKFLQSNVTENEQAVVSVPTTMSESVSLNNDEPLLLPPPPDVAQNDLLLRLGFLLGDYSAAQCSTEAEALDQCVRSSSSPGMHQQSRCGSGEHLHDYSSKPSTLSSPEHEGRHDPMNTSPISTIAEGEPCSGLTMTYNPTFLPGSRDPSTESVTSLISTSTGNSISPQTTWHQAPNGVASLHRPHSTSTNAAGDAEDIGMLGRRRSSARRSAMASLGGTNRNYDVSANKSE